jgi:hypothetical protein
MELADNRWVMSTRFVLFSSEGMDCFVIMPFGDPSVDQAHFDKMENIYSEWIKPTVESIQRSDSPGSFLRCHRADKEVGPGDIVEHVIESLINSRIVIADLTGKNANVFYELGVRHAVSNSTILLAEGTEHIPFDLRTLRAIVYQYTPPGMIRFRRQLQEAVMSIVTAPDKIDNPVRRILYRRESVQLASAQELGVSQVVQTLMSELASMKEELRAQHTEMSTLIGEITTQPVPASRAASPEVVKHLQGVWRNEELDSVYCMRVVGDELRVAYAYGGSKSLTSHFYNCQVVGTLLLCRFQWFSRPDTKGFVALRLKTSTVLEGGWQYAEEISRRSRIEKFVATGFPPSLSPDDPTLSRLVLHKDEGATWPEWAVDYFRQYKA